MREQSIRDKYFSDILAQVDTGPEAGTLTPSTDYPVDFDIRALMEDARDPLTGTLRDLRVDDRDLPLAKNFMDWSLNYTQDNIPWARQMWAMLKLFGEICPAKRCSDRTWYNDIYAIPKDYPTQDLQAKLTLLELGVCPNCKRNKYDLIRKRRLPNYVEGVNVWGQRAGKSATAIKGAAYHTHRFLKFPHPGTLTSSMGVSTPLTATFVALTFSQAHRLLWEPFEHSIASSSWYDQYFELLDYHGQKLGVELYARKKEFIKFFHKKLNLAPSHPHKGILRGDTRYLAIIDELGLFPLPTGDEEEDEESQRANADEAHKSLTNSLVTVQSANMDMLKQGLYHAPTGIMLGVSSPMSRRDKVMRLLEDSKGEVGKDTILGIQLPTWEVNPYINKDSPVIALAYEKNPDKAERDFGANPPATDSMFVSPNVLNDGLFVGKRNTHKAVPVYKPTYTYATLRKIRTESLPTLMSLDAGQVNNSFAVTLFYLEETSGNVVCSTVLEVMPAEGTMINFRHLYDSFLLPLAKDMNTCAVIADRWNSVDILHSMEVDLGEGTYVKQISVNRADFDSVLAMLNNKTVTMPRPEMPMEEFLTKEFENYRLTFKDAPVAHLAHQFTTVREVSPLKPPVKGPGYTDDLLRSFVLGASRIHTKAIRKVLEKALKRSTGSRKASGVLYVSRGARRRR